MSQFRPLPADYVPRQQQASPQQNGGQQKISVIYGGPQWGNVADLAAAKDPQRRFLCGNFCQFGSCSYGANCKSAHVAFGPMREWGDVLNLPMGNGGVQQQPMPQQQPPAQPMGMAQAYAAAGGDPTTPPASGNAALMGQQPTMQQQQQQGGNVALMPGGQPMQQAAPPPRQTSPDEITLEVKPTPPPKKEDKTLILPTKFELRGHNSRRQTLPPDTYCGAEQVRPSLGGS